MERKVVQITSCFLFCLLITNYVVYGQVRFGVKAGANVSNIKNDYSSPNPRLGYQGGLVADFSLSKHFSLRPEVLIHTKGFKRDFEVLDPNSISKSFILKTHLNYLEIPVLALYQAKVGDRAKIFAGVGPYFGLGIGGIVNSDYLGKLQVKYKLTERDFFIKDDIPSLFVNVFRRVDFGGVAAIGISTGKINFEIRYEHGLLDVNSNLSYNRNLDFSVGYWFGKAER